MGTYNDENTDWIPNLESHPNNLLFEAKKRCKFLPFSMFGNPAHRETLPPTLLGRRRAARARQPRPTGMQAGVISAAQMTRIIRDHALPPTRAGVRTLQVVCGCSTALGAQEDRICVNPFLTVDAAPLWPLDAACANELAEHSFALSLAEALKRKLDVEEEGAVLVFLLALVRLSDCARDEMNRSGELPLRVRRGRHEQIAGMVQQECKARLQETGYECGADDWSGWSSAYRLWLREHGSALAPKRLRFQGVDKTLASYDFEGKHLTGGRMWAGSLLLLQW